MTVYIDLLLILNFIYDLLLLMTVSITLKRMISFKRILLGSLFGMLSTLLIFLPINKYILLLFKIISGVVICIITYSYKDIKYTINNVIYLYMSSVILAGFLYYLNIEFGSNCYLISFIIAPLILFLYTKMVRNKNKYNLYQKVIITLKNNCILNLNGYIDSGNNLIDPITNKRIIIINKNRIKGIYNIRSPMYVPYNTISEHTLLPCIPIKNLCVDNKNYNNYLLGLVDNLKIKDGIDCLLNNSMLEDI